MKEVEASGSVTFSRDDGEEQAAGQALMRTLAAFSDHAPMRARIAADARLSGATQD